MLNQQSNIIMLTSFWSKIRFQLTQQTFHFQWIRLCMCVTHSQNSTKTHPTGIRELPSASCTTRKTTSAETHSIPLRSNVDFVNSSKPISSNQRRINFYRPIIFPNNFWQTSNDAYPINDTTMSTLPLTVHLESINVWKFNVYAVLANKDDQQTNNSPSGLDDNLSVLEQGYMFSITLLTCFMHGLFELLAFKNDIGFYRAKTNRIGISVNSLVVHIAIQATLFLYTMDFSKNAIRGCIQLVHLCVNAWKLNHVWLHEYEWVIEQGSDYGFTIRMARSVTRGKHKLVEQGEEKTQQLDTVAFKLLAVVALPLFTVYNAYHYYYHYNMLIYHQLKDVCMEDWTKKVIMNGLVNFLSIFGPIMAVWPQMYINSKMNMWVS
ncbi:hypothetical protein MBANPS3_008594 [Mucor bainieri]